MEPSWGHAGPSGAILGLSWAIFGPCRGHFQPSRGHLGRSWESFGAILGHLGASWGHLDRTWGHLGASWGHVDLLGAISGPSWPYLGRSWAVLGLSFKTGENARGVFHKSNDVEANSMSLRRIPFNLDVFSLRGHLVAMLVHLANMFSCVGARDLERASRSNAYTGLS